MVLFANLQAQIQFCMMLIVFLNSVAVSTQRKSLELESRLQSMEQFCRFLGGAWMVDLPTIHVFVDAIFPECTKMPTNLKIKRDLPVS